MRVRLEGVTKRYGDDHVVDQVSLDVQEGELLVILGPSGSGKSTLLHLVAGLAPPDAGSILLGDVDVTRTPPQERGTPLVLQRHALFPHLTLLDNVAFGLRMRGVGRREREDAAARALQDVRLEGLAARYPSEVSGGQAQRVALARALVTEPRVLLLDEPFSGLDAALRVEMQDLLLELHRARRITTIFVTHDQREALRLGGRIAILHEGRIRQVGPAREVYERPASVETARFLGLTNILPATLRDGRVHLEEVGSFPAPSGAALPDGPVCAAFRPESVALLPAEAPTGTSMRVVGVTDHGPTVTYGLRSPAGLLEATELGPPRLVVGDEVRAAFGKAPWILPPLLPPPEAPPSDRSSEPLNGASRKRGS